MVNNLASEVDDHLPKSGHYVTSHSVHYTRCLLYSGTEVNGGKLGVHCINSGTPLSGHPSIADICYVVYTSENPDCPSIHFNTSAIQYKGHFFALPIAILLMTLI